MKAVAVRDPGSFRDPAGYVVSFGERVLRVISPDAGQQFDHVKSTGVYDELVGRGWLLPAEPVVDTSFLSTTEGERVLEHPRIDPITYPYEWPFSLLKRAALLQLDIHLLALDSDVTLSDASAYNIQFRGVEPVFVDILSLRRYREGEIWYGQQQFYNQFLNPLLFTCATGVPYHAWYRGAQEGIATGELTNLLNLRQKLSLRTLMHVTLPAMLQQRSRRKGDAGSALRAPHLSLKGLRNILTQLRGWIDTLEPRYGASDWEGYAEVNSYKSEEEDQKRLYLQEFTTRYSPSTVWDIGCNTGEYSELMLAAGAGSVVGFDADHNALERAVKRATKSKLNFLPLYLDAANPSPDQGWNQAERGGLMRRARADAVVALALEHHLAIGRNIPLPDLVSWLVGLAPRGIIEFVPKSDPMVQRMLQIREDVFPNYTQESFEHCLQHVARIAGSRVISGSGRILYTFERDSSDGR